MWSGKTVTIVFPAYNEEPNIARAVAEFFAVKQGDTCLVDEVVVADNNSKDRTGELAKQAGARVVLETKQGYGHALQRGLRYHRADAQEAPRRSTE